MYMIQELNTFQREIFDTSITRHADTILSPLNQLSLSAPVDYLCLPSEHAKSLTDVHLLGKFKLTKSDGTEYTKTDTVQPALVNNFLSSLIKTLHISFNNVNVLSFDHYGYKSYIESILSNSPEALSHREPSMFYHPDTYQNDQKDRIKNSKTFDCHTRLSLFNIPKFLPPMISFSLRLTFQDKEFVLLEQETETTDAANAAKKVFTSSKLEILELKLILKTFTIRETVLLELEKTFLKSDATICHKRAHLSIAHLPSGTTQFRIANITTLPIRPTLLLCAFVDTNAFSGNSQSDPFVFGSHSLNSFNWLLDESIYSPSNEPLVIEDDDQHECLSYFYAKSLEALGMVHEETNSNFFSYKNYLKNHFFIIADSTYNGSSMAAIHQPLVSTQVGVQGNFKTALKSALTLLVYTVIDSKIRINSNRIVELLY